MNMVLTPLQRVLRGLIGNHILHTIRNGQEDRIEREKTVAQFKSIKRGTFVQSSTSFASAGFPDQPISVASPAQTNAPNTTTAH